MKKYRRRVSIPNFIFRLCVLIAIIVGIVYGVFWLWNQIFAKKCQNDAPQMHEQAIQGELQDTSREQMRSEPSEPVLSEQASTQEQAQDEPQTQETPQMQNPQMAVLAPTYDPQVASQFSHVKNEQGSIYIMLNKKNSFEDLDYKPDDLVVPDIDFPFTHDTPKKYMASVAQMRWRVMQGCKG